MIKFDFTKDEYETISEQLMLNDELKKILEMRIKGYSIVQMSMEMNMSEATIKRRIATIKKKIMKIL